MKGLTLWQPWAWAIVSGHKRIENRPWAPWPAVIGKVIAIHAGKVYDKDGEEFLRGRGITLPPAARTASAIVGAARVTGFVELGQLHPDPALDDPMFFGPFGWKLDEIRMLATPIPCKGALGLWEVPDPLYRSILEGDSK